jgi:hypothetical protein
MSANPLTPDTPLQLAELFHETYERLAPSFGYDTRPDTRAFNPETPNGRLMVAVCRKILATIQADRLTSFRAGFDRGFAERNTPIRASDVPK